MTNNKIDQELLDLLFIQLVLADHTVVQVDLVIDGIGNNTPDLEMFFKAVADASPDSIVVERACGLIVVA